MNITAYLDNVISATWKVYDGLGTHNAKKGSYVWCHYMLLQLCRISNSANVSFTLRILISFPRRFWDFCRFFLLIALMATVSRGRCKK